MSQETSQQTTELYAVLGELAITFSNLEHNIRHILNLLIDGNQIVGPVVTDALGIARVVKHARTYTKIRLDPPMRDRLLSLLKQVDEVRIERNLFIHGQWPDKIQHGNHVSCLDYRLKYEKGSQLWTYLQEYRFSIDELHRKCSAIASLRDEALDVLGELHTHYSAIRNELLRRRPPSGPEASEATWQT